MSQQSRANRCAIRTEATDPPPTPPTNPNTPLHPAARHVCIHVLKELASLGLFVLFVLVLLLVLFFSQPNRRSQVTKWYASTPSTPPSSQTVQLTPTPPPSLVVFPSQSFAKKSGMKEAATCGRGRRPTLPPAAHGSHFVHVTPPSSL